MMAIWSETQSQSAEDENKNRFAGPVAVVMTLVAVVAFSGGWIVSAVFSSRLARSAVESSVVESVHTVKPFLFVNGKPVMILSTLRQDGSTVYFGVKQ